MDSNLIDSLEKGKSLPIVFIGIDPAKSVFAVHGVDEHSKPALVRPKVARAKLTFFSRADPCRKDHRHQDLQPFQCRLSKRASPRRVMQCHCGRENVGPLGALGGTRAALRAQE
jgi:hypothetical protein